MRSGMVTWYRASAIAVALVLGSLSGAWADGSWGGSGGSSGGGSWGARGYASSGGSSGGRVGPLRRLIAHIGQHHQRGGSSGGSWGGQRWGSNGGSSGGSVSHWGSSGGSSGGSRGNGSSGGYASRGGSSGGYVSAYSVPGSGTMYSGQVIEGSSGAYYSDPNASPGAQPAAGQANPVDANKPPVPETPNDAGQPDATSTDAGGDAVLRVNVPTDCVVTINGKQTKTSGSSRQYVSRNLKYTQAYPYEIQATVVRDGKTLSQTKVVDLSGGVQREVHFDFDSAEQVLTSLSISVPADAQVTLGGSQTRAQGAFRYYSTKALQPGQTWENYEIQVSLERNGETLTQSKVVDLTAGASLELDFDFDPTAVAAK